MIKRYRCYSLNELFWGGYFNYDPKPFIRHVLCSSAYIYSLSPNNYFMDYNNSVVFIFPPAKLNYNFKLPQIQTLVLELISTLNLHFRLFFKPAFYLYIILIFFLFKKKFRIFILPSILNTIILLFVTTTDDFRFTYPNYLISLILLMKALKF